MVCEVCNLPIVRGEAKGYVNLDAVHSECVPAADMPCMSCWLVHAGSCW
jgi:hypothetical protein